MVSLCSSLPARYNGRVKYVKVKITNIQIMFTYFYIFVAKK